LSKERICIECGGWVPDDAPPRTRVCSEECRSARKAASTGSLDARHKLLVAILTREHCPLTDPLFSKNYFEKILLANDSRCIYDDAPLSPSGHTLDRVNNKKFHTAANVIGPVCSDCNSLRGDRLTAEEMFILRPKLIEIRERRELVRMDRWRRNILKINRAH